MHVPFMAGVEALNHAHRTCVSSGSTRFTQSLAESLRAQPLAPSSSSSTPFPFPSHQPPRVLISFLCWWHTLKLADTPQQLHYSIIINNHHRSEGYKAVDETQLSSVELLQKWEQFLTSDQSSSNQRCWSKMSTCGKKREGRAAEGGKLKSRHIQEHQGKYLKMF